MLVRGIVDQTLREGELCAMCEKAEGGKEGCVCMQVCMRLCKRMHPHMRHAKCYPHFIVSRSHAGTHPLGHLEEHGGVVEDGVDAAQLCRAYVCTCIWMVREGGCKCITAAVIPPLLSLVYSCKDPSDERAVV